MCMYKKEKEDKEDTVRYRNPDSDEIDAYNEAIRQKLRKNEDGKFDGDLNGSFINFVEIIKEAASEELEKISPKQKQCYISKHISNWS